MIVRLVVILTLVLSAATAQAQFWDARALAIDPAKSTEPVAPKLTGLSDLHHAVTTKSPESQAFFDQGLRLAYGFNHSEAIRAYKEAARLDPDNAMAYWGWAYALGPNLNLPMLPEVTEQAYAAAQKAMSLRDKVTPAERDLIEAMAKRYASPAPENRAALDQAFADAMRDVAAKHPSDPEALTVYADALMNLSPWNYWNADGTPHPNTPIIVDSLESVVRRYPAHIGALHLHIHAVEAVNGQRAEVSADRLLKLAPAAGHLVHMPSHVYMKVGRYADAYASNALADAADNSYVAQCNAQGIYPLFYHRHNQHFLTWAAMYQGRSQAALDAGRLIAKGLEPPMVTASGPLSETIQHLMSQPLYVMVRFGRWSDILAEPQPAAEYGFMTAIWHYARGMAYVGTGKSGPAKKELAAVEKAAAAMKDKMVGFAPASSVLAIAGEVLAAGIDAAAGNRDRAIARLDRAVRIQDGFQYNEPPDWYFPVRHYLGAELLAAGRAPEAETVYWQDLARNPENGYALFGLQQALTKQGKTAQAAAVTEQFGKAWHEADVKLASSRF